MKEVNKSYVREYFEQHDKVLARLKEIAQIMYENSEGHDLGPYQTDWDEEHMVHCGWGVRLDMRTTDPYESWEYEECYKIPYVYLDASDEDIAADVSAGEAVTLKHDKEKRLKAFKEEAEALGYVINKEGSKL